jgi:hypothetical protein
MLHLACAAIACDIERTGDAGYSFQILRKVGEKGPGSFFCLSLYEIATSLHSSQ